MGDDQNAINNERQLKEAVSVESAKFEESYRWLEKSMGADFFRDIPHERIVLIAHNLISFELQSYFMTIFLEDSALVLCLDNPRADIEVLEQLSLHGIRGYQTYQSQQPYRGAKKEGLLRIVSVSFTTVPTTSEQMQSEESIANLFAIVNQRAPEVTEEEFNQMIMGMQGPLLRTLPKDRSAAAVEMFLRSRTRDNCQYEVFYHEDWMQTGEPSMEVLFAWRNTSKHNFLLSIAQLMFRHKLKMKRVSAAYIEPYTNRNILVMRIGIHGANGDAVWDVANTVDFMRELVTIKYFNDDDQIAHKLVSRGIIDGIHGNLLRAIVNFVHQILLNLDVNAYRLELIEEALCHHPDLTIKMIELFQLKFNPSHPSLQRFEEKKNELLSLISKLDTGNDAADTRRKNVLTQSIAFIDYCLKTNFYRRNYTAMSFRIDPQLLEHLPYDRKEFFPELPFGIFYMRGMHSIGFHVRFKDLSRGGLRTIFPRSHEQMVYERNNVFRECYSLAYTQQKKNKDIPEGGSKGVVFLYPYSQLEIEKTILTSELESAKLPVDVIQERLKEFEAAEISEYVFHAQRSYIESLITLVNCESDGSIRAKYIVDYYSKPEYIYLGPDERMSDFMIDWIAEFSKKYGYKPGGAFISSKPKTGFNHKEFGVTSYGVNVCLHQVLLELGINPEQDRFTIKMSGGPDGDVAGNQIKNLYRFYPDTAKLIALTDVSGTIYDPEGLDLKTLVELFEEVKPIRCYPPELLHPGGVLLDREIKQQMTSLITHTLCWENHEGELIKKWIAGSEMNHLFRHNVHQRPADVFVPAGGRPRTISISNIGDFLDETGKPTAKAIVEGANLYVTEHARKALESKGVLIIKDSSANKGGVICSSFEVLTSLVVDEEKFLDVKQALIQEILEHIKKCTFNESRTLLGTHRRTGRPMTEISDEISKKINLYTYQILDHLQGVELSSDPEDPLNLCFLTYCLPTLRHHFQKELIDEVPDQHKKAIIACHVASQIVYCRGVDWSPSIVDVLPNIWRDPTIVTECILYDQ